MTHNVDALVIGAGPSGLMAAETLAASGRKVVVVDAKPSFGRKFLMAGKSGLNITKDEPLDQFLTNFAPQEDTFLNCLRDFGPEQVQIWAQGLHQDIFTGSSGRVFPKAMKASPLLRAWLARLVSMDVEFRTRHKWTKWIDNDFVFETPDGQFRLSPKVTVLALGGASWARLGSDGVWAKLLSDRGISTTDFAPSNVGLQVEWSTHMQKHFGKPVKGIALTSGAEVSRGEIVISAKGIEGSGIYALTARIRDGHPLALDLLPDWPIAKIVQRLEKARAKDSTSNKLRKSLHLNSQKLALWAEFGEGAQDFARLASTLKTLKVRHQGPRPLDEAISTVGGLPFSTLDPDLMLTAAPGVFACGEMLDWDAPTGGYLINGCLALGRTAGKGAAQWQDD